MTGFLQSSEIIKQMRLSVSILHSRCFDDVSKYIYILLYYCTYPGDGILYTTKICTYTYISMKILKTDM
jgi:hypothetical protein